MRVRTTPFPGPAQLGQALAAVIADGIAATPPGGQYLLGCPSGRSPVSTYQALADEVSRRGLDLRGVVIVMMDEYLEADAGSGELRYVDPGAPHSCARFGRMEIVERLNRAAPPGRGIDPDRLWLPDLTAPERYDEQLADAGGIDLFILASGTSDGHVAFNPPGTKPDAGTRAVELAEPTRRDNLSTFATFDGDLNRVPRWGLTVGVGTIRDLSKRAVMVVHGAEKGEAVRRLQAAEQYEPDWPATILTECADPELYVDAAALGEPSDSFDHDTQSSPASASTR